MHSFITNKTFDFMSVTVKRGLILPVKLFVIWQPGKKAGEMPVYILLYQPTRYAAKKTSEIWYQIRYFKY